MNLIILLASDWYLAPIVEMCLSLYSVDSLRALICYCFVNYCLLY